MTPAEWVGFSSCLVGIIAATTILIAIVTARPRPVQHPDGRWRMPHHRRHR